MNELVAFFKRLDLWVANGSRTTLDRTVQVLAASYRHRIKSGLDAELKPLAPLKPATLQGPIRRGDVSGEGSSRRTRGDLGNTPMSATGQTGDSITGKIVSRDAWEISSSTTKGDKILASNAKASHSGDRAFYGDVRKAVRDPLQLSDKQMDLLEDQIVQALERALI